ncbi:glycosyltransferase family 4 protein [Alkalicoccobacillus plakortidis]|uniref:Glycosyltransferase family 4 protein n=1 Tax=Alkalicoccobacillus plakortidis TaxID=444060 RepID=A0ABT0XJ43_9BACI|nr:glycosyltransferase family 4 protein [Alkalicoccobacillus plakortidis]MCM2675911.1 glycosyltransferase family 4 protein [Alkalicoccobacillus plakortidis]
MKVAIIHDWLTTYAGAEKVLEQILEIYPQADIYSIVDYIDADKRGFIKNKKVHTSFIQKLPKSKKKYRNYLGLMPLAIEQFDLSEYHLIISSSHAIAKGVITGPDQIHICYIHSPIRYAWDLQHQYLKEAGITKGIKSWIARATMHYMRVWDSRTANGVDEFISNSEFIKRRVWKAYKRNSVVIHPPVDIDSFKLTETKSEYFLTASRLVPYKKIDLIVEAFNDMPEKKLVVIGDGPDYLKIKKIAGDNIEMLGYLEFDKLINYMQNAKAFVFAAEEDFGIIPVESQACGTPVIAFGKGGITDTVIDISQKSEKNPTGVFFPEQNVGSLKAAINKFEKNEEIFHPIKIRENALNFSEQIFKEKFKSFVDKKVSEFKLGQ